MRLAWCVALACLSACSPFAGGGAFHCAEDSQCTGQAGGRCELNGFCSFADSTCPAGQRFGTSSGGASNACVGDEPPVDAPENPGSEATLPGVDAQACFGTPLRVCLAQPLPAQPLTISGPLSTDSGCTQVIPQTNGQDLCVRTGTTIDVADTRVTGARVLVLVATTSITVTGSLDASSTGGGGGVHGAAANPATCDLALTKANPGVGDQGGGSGGAGGSFGGKGGDGGNGDKNNNGPPSGSSTGGAAGAVQLPTIVRGGCNGAKGGDGLGGGGTGGNGAFGGGAIYLIAGSSITIASTGSVYASGAGADGAGNEAGGGGGGSGGMLGFDAPTITVTGKVAANGGGGGGGGGNSGGQPGGNGTTSMWNVRAAGGVKAPQCTDGGRGTATATVDGETAAFSDGGSGGGGGGIGVIWTHGTVTGTQISPAATAK